MTSTAEIVRERPEPPRPEPAEGPVASPPPVQPVVDFKSIAENLLKSAPAAPPKEELDAARMKATDAREAASKRASDFAAAQAPEIEATKKAGEAFAAEALKARPQAPQLPPPPSKGLHGFLQPTKDEQPETSIAKLLQGVGLLATMIGGGRNGARASLSAFTGALEGWKAGDRERADRAFADWKAQTDKMLEQWQVELGGYESWMRASGIPLEQKMLGLKLDAMARGNQKFADEIDVGNADSALKGLEARQAQALDVQKEAAKLYAMHEEAGARHQERVQFHQDMLDQKIELLKLRREQIAKADQGVAMSPETLERIANERANGESWTNLVRGFGKSVVAKTNEIDNRATQILMERGDEPGARMLNASRLQANRAALTDLTKKEAQWAAFARAFEPAVERMLKLARAVDDRSGRPIFDKWLLRGRSEFQGDPDVAALNLQMETVSQEFARVVQRSGMTTEATRAEARANFNNARTPEQLERIIKEVTRPDVEYARSAFEAEKASLMDQIRSPKPVAKEPAKPSGGTMQIRRKSDGMVFEGPSGPIPAGYEAVK